MKKNKRGFTMVEMVLVVGIIVIMATVLTAGLNAYIDSANRRAARVYAQGDSYDQALMAIRGMCNASPAEMPPPTSDEASSGHATGDGTETGNSSEGTGGGLGTIDNNTPAETGTTEPSTSETDATEPSTSETEATESTSGTEATEPSTSETEATEPSTSETEATEPSTGSTEPAGPGPIGGNTSTGGTLPPAGPNDIVLNDQIMVVGGKIVEGKGVKDIKQNSDGSYNVTFQKEGNQYWSNSVDCQITITVSGGKCKILASDKKWIMANIFDNNTLYNTPGDELDLGPTELEKLKTEYGLIIAI